MSGQRILRRFPFALSLGTDICHVIRIRKILESSRGTRFVQRILNEEERGHPKLRCILNDRPCTNGAKVLGSHDQTTNHHTGVTAAHENIPSLLRAGPSLEELQLAATFMAGRFAAKEAVIKAHPQRNLTWHGITISHQASTHADRKGAPAAIIRGTNEDYEALISISHDGEYATAVCLGAEHADQTDD
ncbi:hypothetical protein Daus18300_002742 [Diaporthe australafricana]|uniref:4'-phosphopantetheinyl transferase domain-containing protein n=1 Tax=Diaporthe australafricana TaxID=127596 RepID=A0ABR3XKJ1_9PEZI